MPVCLHCSRTFLSKEALHQHIRSSSVEHPFCAACDRRFISQAACDSHMAAKHPPTFDCVPCNRNFPALFALEDHYRGSGAHPNCTKCGRGFKDLVDRDEHQSTAHPKRLCPTCGVLTSEDSLEDHYLQSADHPSCKQCSCGFKDDRSWAEHMALGHPELCCEQCERQFETVEAIQIHYFASPMHPECMFCKCGFKDNVEYSVHMQSHQSLADMEIELESGAGHVGSVHGFSPLSPRTFKDLIGGDTQIDTLASPVLSLHMDYASPIKDVPTPLFSPATLPRPGRVVDEVWTARDNVQAPFSRAPQWPLDLTNVAKISPSPLAQIPLSNDNIDKELDRPLSYYRSSPPVSDTYSEQPHSLSSWRTSHTEAKGRNNLTSPDASATRLSPTKSWRARPPQLLAGTNHPSDNRAAGQHSTSVKYGLYAGSALSRFRSSSLLSPSTSESKTPLESSIIHPFGRSIVNWRELMGDRDPLLKVTRESSLSDDISTHAVDTPVHTYAVLDPTSSPLDVDSISPNSMSLPGSSSPWTTPLPNSAPAVVSPSHNLSLYITPPNQASFQSNGSNSQSSQSPDVCSPVGLAPLPIVAPLASSPVDVQHQPLAGVSPEPHVHELTSVSPKSPLHIAFDTKLPDSPSIESHTSSQHSFTTITSPQDSNWDHPFQGDVLAVKLPDSPTSEHALSPVQEPPPASYASDQTGHHNTRGTEVCVDCPKTPANYTGDGLPKEEDSPSSEQALSPVQERPLTSYDQIGHHDARGTDVHVNCSQTPVSYTADGLPEEDARSPSPERSGTPPTILYPGLHCRLCHSDPGVDLTATMCGHIFCYKCITEEIIKNPRCPVCTTPTLLYCLFRLDLSV